MDNFDMPNEVRFNLRPIPKPRMTQSDRWKKRPIVERYYRFKDELNRQSSAMNFVFPFSMELCFHLAMPKSWSVKKRNKYNGTYHQSKPDLDNLCKAVMDSMLTEDMQVYRINMTKYWSEEDYIIIRY